MKTTEETMTRLITEVMVTQEVSPNSTATELERWLVEKKKHGELRVEILSDKSQMSGTFVSRRKIPWWFCAKRVGDFNPPVERHIIMVMDDIKIGGAKYNGFWFSSI